MKLLIMCEGPNELKIINILLENQKLKFSSDDLLGLVPYHARQIKSSAAVKAALNLYPDEVWGQQLSRSGEATRSAEEEQGR